MLDSRLTNIKNTKQAAVTIPVTSAGSLYTTDIDISDKPAIFQLLKGFAITSSSELIPIQIYFNNSSSIHIRVRALATSDGYLIIYYI